YAHAPEIKEPQSAAESKKKSSRSNAKATHNRERAEEGFVRFFFGAGKHDKFYAKEIIGLLNRYTFEPVEVGRIDLKNNFAFFEVREKDAELVEGALRNAKDRNGR
ncbi:MAG TPA: ATP-dependent RNA helicase, partial [Prevotellaceae bacterium]|nr:ATP-dependent RNA helicase [Prevotellaceae bacterium]